MYMRAGENGTNNKPGQGDPSVRLIAMAETFRGTSATGYICSTGRHQYLAPELGYVRKA